MQTHQTSKCHAATDADGGVHDCACQQGPLENPQSPGGPKIPDSVSHCKDGGTDAPTVSLVGCPWVQDLPNLALHKVFNMTWATVKAPILMATFQKSQVGAFTKGYIDRLHALSISLKTKAKKAPPAAVVVQLPSHTDSFHQLLCDAILDDEDKQQAPVNWLEFIWDQRIGACLAMVQVQAMQDSWPV